MNKDKTVIDVEIRSILSNFLKLALARVQNTWLIKIDI